jgi:hypothetical protein
MDKLKLVFWVLVVAGALLKPILKRRKERSEAEKRSAADPARPESAEVPEDDGGPSLPYESLVEEVFGPYIARRRESAQPRPKAPATARAPLPPPTRATAGEPPKPVVSKLAAPPPSPATPTQDSPAGRESAESETPSPRRSVEQHLFGRRRLSSSAKLIIAAEILRPPRVLRERGRFWNR